VAGHFLKKHPVPCGNHQIGCFCDCISQFVCRGFCACPAIFHNGLLGLFSKRASQSKQTFGAKNDLEPAF